MTIPPGMIMLWIHLVAAMTWVGGMVVQWIVLGPAFKPAPGESPHGALRSRIEERFRKLRWASLITLLITGVFNLLNEGASARMESAWGGVLMIKLLLVAVAIGLTGVYDFMPDRRGGSGTAKRSWRGRDGLSAVILILGVLIAGLAVYLGGA